MWLVIIVVLLLVYLAIGFFIIHNIELISNIHYSWWQIILYAIVLPMVCVVLWGVAWMAVIVCNWQAKHNLQRG